MMSLSEPCGQGPPPVPEQKGGGTGSAVPGICSGSPHPFNPVNASRGSSNTYYGVWVTARCVKGSELVECGRLGKEAETVLSLA